MSWECVKYVSGTRNFQAEQTANQMYTTLISTDDVSTHFDGTWAIIDCRFDLQHPNWGRDQYLLSHIPGAVYAHLDRDLSGPKTGKNGRHPLPDVAAHLDQRAAADRRTPGPARVSNLSARI